MSDHTQGPQLPQWLPNYDLLSCAFCKRRPESIVPRWHGPHIGAHCPKCGGRLGPESFWLKRSKYNLDLFAPPAKEEPGQEALFGDCA